MCQRHKHFLVSEPCIAHVVLHDRIATTEAVLFLQPLIDPLCRVLAAMGIVWISIPAHDQAFRFNEVASLGTGHPFVAKRANFPYVCRSFG